MIINKSPFQPRSQGSLLPALGERETLENSLSLFLSLIGWVGENPGNEVVTISGPGRQKVG